MHGWISLPAIWQITLLALAPLIGLSIGVCDARNKHQWSLWLGYAAAYAISVTLVAFLYESHGHLGGGYNLGAWALMIALPVFIYALPAIGVPWLIARVVARARLSSAELQQHPAGKGVSATGKTLMATALVLFVLLFAVVSENAPTVPMPRSNYVMPPLDPAHAPSDLSAVTDGSDWVCNILSEGKPTQSMVDYHFDALAAGGRWQSFSHHGERPFFDLDHARQMEQFFSGPYSVANAKLQLGSDYAGMPIELDRRFAKQSDRDALRANHDPRLRGEILLTPNAFHGSIESIGFRSLSASEMSLVVDYANDVPYSSELACRRIHQATFRPVEIPLTEPRSPAA